MAIEAPGIYSKSHLLPCNINITSSRQSIHLNIWKLTFFIPLYFVLPAPYVGDLIVYSYYFFIVLYFDLIISIIIIASIMKRFKKTNSMREEVELDISLVLPTAPKVGTLWPCLDKFELNDSLAISECCGLLIYKWPSLVLFLKTSIERTYKYRSLIWILDRKYPLIIITCSTFIIFFKIISKCLLE